MNCKKRKPDTDGLALEAERSLHQSFVHAANAVSQLYTHALTHQHKRAHVDGARQVLVRRCQARARSAAHRQTALGVSPLQAKRTPCDSCSARCAGPASRPASPCLPLLQGAWIRLCTCSSACKSAPC